MLKATICDARHEPQTCPSPPSPRRYACDVVRSFGKNSRIVSGFGSPQGSFLYSLCGKLRKPFPDYRMFFAYIFISVCLAYVWLKLKHKLMLRGGGDSKITRGSKGSKN